MLRNLFENSRGAAPATLNALSEGVALAMKLEARTEGFYEKTFSASTSEHQQAPLNESRSQVKAEAEAEAEAEVRAVASARSNSSSSSS